MMIGILRSYQDYLRHIATMEGWYWKALCNEGIEFRLQQNLNLNPGLYDLKSGALTTRPPGRFSKAVIMRILSLFFLYEDMPRNVQTYESKPLGKRTFGNVRHAKIQISIRIRTVCSESLLGAFWIAKDETLLNADNDDTGQTARIHMSEGTFSHVVCSYVHVEK